MPASKQRAIPQALINPSVGARHKRGVKNRRTESRGGEGRDVKVLGGFREVTHLLDFGMKSREPSQGYLHKRLGEGPRLQARNPVKGDAITVNVNRGRARSRGGEEVLVVEYSGQRPETREVDRILKRVVAPPSMLTCHKDRELL